VRVNWRSRSVWWGVFGGSLIPLSERLYQMFWGDLGTDPGKTLTESLGTIALCFLGMTLAITPLKRWFSLSLVHLRRMQGLFTFFYASLHVGAYLLFLADWSAFMDDVIKRPYIFVGLAAFLILLALAATSFKTMMRRLGRHWKTLHRLVYPAGVLVVVHYAWQSRGDYTTLFIYSLSLLLLLSARLPQRVFHSARSPEPE
jgi:sulfoxide reductase heme-binding subunit YedZ